MPLSTMSTFEQCGERALLLSKLAKYAPIDNRDCHAKEQFIIFIQRSRDSFSRDHYPGHITGSSWIVSDDGHSVLLHHHQKLDIWVQLGGHADGCTDVLSVALREAEEESGISGFEVISEDIFDLDIHLIPARRDEPEHYHYDVRFLFRAPCGAMPVCSVESREIRWVAISELSALSAEESIARMARKAAAILALSSPTH